MTSSQRIRIGISACMMHPETERRIFNGRALDYLEASLGAWVSSEGALAYMIPSEVALRDLGAVAEDLDALVLAGGVDMAPASYGQAALRPEWCGDAKRDAYEIGLAKAFLQEDKPVLGVCRGHQLLNVALGGTLYQDISTQVPGSLVHRDADLYEKNRHEIALVAGSRLSELYGGALRGIVNSVHHQAVAELAPGLVVEATSSVDTVVEAFCDPARRFVRGVQWHPEFCAPDDPTLLHNGGLLRDLAVAALARRQEAR